MSGSTTPVSEYSSYAMEIRGSRPPVVFTAHGWDTTYFSGDDEPLVGIEDIYPDGDLIINVSCRQCGRVARYPANTPG